MRTKKIVHKLRNIIGYFFMRAKVDHFLNRLGCCLLFLLIGMNLGGCASSLHPTSSSSEIEYVATTMPPLPKGEVYVDEQTVRMDSPIVPGDSLDVAIHNGEDQTLYSPVVRVNGMITVGLIDAKVGELTTEQAGTVIKEKALKFFRYPRVQVRIKERKQSIKRVLVIGEVDRPGVVPLTRNMSVFRSIVEAGNYKETANLEEIRIIRRNPQGSVILTVDLDRLLSNGDGSGNLPLEENDIVFVPRTTFGDAELMAKRLLPFVQLVSAPFYAALTLGTIK